MMLTRLSWTVPVALFVIATADDGLASNFDRAFPTRNSHLREQLENDPQRVLPKSDLVSWAVDAEFYKPSGDVDSDDTKYNYYPGNPYHGNGFWIESRVELQPFRQFRLNMKLVPWYGTTSFGYGAASRIFMMGALNFEDGIGESGWQFRTLVSDLGMQTFGLGTIVEDRPMTGAFLEFEKGDIRFRQTYDGTGTLKIAGEMYNSHLSFRDELLSMGIVAYQKQGKYYADQDKVTGYVGSRIWFGPSGSAAGNNVGASSDGTGRIPRDYVGVEISANDAAFAALLKARLSGEAMNGELNFLFEPSVRRYGNGFGGTLVGSTEQGYTGYDLEGVSYTNPINIYRVDDNVTVPAARLFASYPYAKFGDFFVDSEAGKMYFAEARQEFYHFWSLGTRVYPVSNRKDYLSVSLTDKLLAAYNPTYGPTDPSSADKELNKPRFVRELQAILTLHGSF